MFDFLAQHDTNEYLQVFIVNDDDYNRKIVNKKQVNRCGIICMKISKQTKNLIFESLVDRSNRKNVSSGHRTVITLWFLLVFFLLRFINEISFIILLLAGGTDC